MSLATRAAVVGLAAVAPTLTLAQPAFAHAALVSTTPAAGSVVTTSPAHVVLEFDEAVLSRGAGIIVTDSGGTHFEQPGTLTYAGATLSISLSPLGAPGTYTVSARWVADDGDPQSTSYAFRYAPTGPAASQTATSAASPSASSSAGNASGSASGGSGGTSWGLVAFGGAAAVAVTGVVLVRRRGRRPGDAS